MSSQVLGCRVFDVHVVMIIRGHGHHITHPVRLPTCAVWWYGSPTRSPEKMCIIVFVLSSQIRSWSLWYILIILIPMITMQPLIATQLSNMAVIPTQWATPESRIPVLGSCPTMVVPKYSRPGGHQLKHPPWFTSGTPQRTASASGKCSRPYINLPSRLQTCQSPGNCQASAQSVFCSVFLGKGSHELNPPARLNDDNAAMLH